LSEILSLLAAEYKRTGMDNNPNDRNPFQTVVAMYVSRRRRLGQYTLDFRQVAQIVPRL
jgi:hypothetical protein